MATAITSPAHTSGSWIVDPYGAHDTGNKLVKVLNGPVICELDPVPEAEANAQLIANAPALLKSCKDLIDSIDMGDLFDHDFDCQEPETCVLCIARQVITDAGG